MFVNRSLSNLVSPGPINKPLNNPAIFYTVKNTIEKPVPQEKERKKYKFFQKVKPK